MFAVEALPPIARYNAKPSHQRARGCARAPASRANRLFFLIIWVSRRSTHEGRKVKKMYLVIVKFETCQSLRNFDV